MMKRWIALLAVLCLLPFSAAFAEGAVSAPGVYPITEDDVELKIWVVQTSQTGPVDTLEQTKWYEEFSGVKVNWVTVPVEEVETKFNLAISDTDYPDIFLYAINSGELYNLAMDGVVIPLNDLIEKNGFYIKTMLDELDMWKEVTAPDGNIYSLLASTYLMQNSMFNKVWVLRDWLAQYTEATGKGMPETLDEMYAMLCYFRDNDMNGNGDPSDEIPLTGTFDRWTTGSDPMFWLMNAFLYCPNDFLVTDAQNNVSLAATQDAFREGLIYCRKLYDEGLLAEETYVQNLTQLRQITSVYEQNAIAGVVAGMNPMRVVSLSAEKDKVSYEDYQAVPPVAGPDGVRIAPRRAKTQVDLRCFITSACKRPDVALKWLDYWCSREGSRWVSYLGQENVHWAWADEPSFAGDEKSVKSLVEWKSPQDVYWTITWFADYYITEEMFTAKAAASTYTDNELAGNLAEQAYLPYAQMTGFPQIVWCQDNDLATEKAELDAMFQKYIIGACTQFIMGANDVRDDAAWNAFLNELDRMGLDRYLEVVKAYNFGA